MTRDKANSERKRVIVDLSWPIGHSVNSGSSGSFYEDVQFVLSLPTIDHVIKAVDRFGKDSFIAKIDISRAFKHVPIDPKDINFLGVFWGAYYVEKRLVFGFRNGSTFFQRIAESIRFILTSEGHYCLAYIDDFLIFGNEAQCNRAFTRLHELLRELGLDISDHKTVAPITEVLCLGIKVDTKALTLSVPSEKLSEIKNTLSNWQIRNTCTKNQLQSLLGSLLFITKCVKHSRFFLNHLLDTLRSHNKDNIITLDSEAHKDIKWFQKFVHVFNGTTFFKKETFQFQTHLDACLSGIGGVCKNEVYHAPIPSNLANSNIATLEMLNILVAIRVWAEMWKNFAILIHCDNKAVVEVLNKGKTKDKHLAAISRNIFMTAARFDIEFDIGYTRLWQVQRSSRSAIQMAIS